MAKTLEKMNHAELWAEFNRLAPDAGLKKHTSAFERKEDGVRRIKYVRKIIRSKKTREAADRRRAARAAAQAA